MTKRVDKMEDIEQLERQLKEACEELQHVKLILAYAIKQNEGKLEVSEEFILDFQHSDIEIFNEKSAHKREVIYRARTKSQSYFFNF